MTDSSKLAGALGVWPLAFLLLFPFTWLAAKGPSPTQVPPPPLPALEPPSPAPPPAELERSASVSGYCLSRFLTPLEHFTGPSNAELPEEVSNWPEVIERQVIQNLQQLGAQPRIETLLATLPDPIDSGFGYKFDTALQAIRLGVERPLQGREAQFRDASWLSWDDSVEKPEERLKSEACRHELPSLVMFRGSTGSNEMTALLLVGETATTGLHQAAMVRAASIADIIRKASQRFGSLSYTEPLRILGPTFSGSAASLRSALLQWTDPDNRLTGSDPLNPNHELRRVSIVTGSATGGGLRRSLRSIFDEDSAWFPMGDVDFWATTVPEAELNCRYLWFVSHGSKDATLESVALLHESGTEFGGVLTHGSPSAGSGAAGAPSSCRYVPGLDVSFPAHISALRDAYERMDRGLGAPAKVSAARRTALDVSLRERRLPQGIDANPSDKTTFARDVSMSRVLDSIAQSTVRHVVIQATDVADAIFIARKIRDATPDVRIAFLGADVLLLHPAFEETLRGSLVVTPYPFLGASDFVPTWANRDPDQPPPRHIEGFESSMAQGIYNATLALRGAHREELHEYVAPQGGGDLPVWIAAIGTGRFVPLAVVPNSVPAGRRDIVANPVFPGFDTAAGTFAADQQRLESDALQVIDLEIPAGERWQKAAGPLHRNKLKLGSEVALPRLWQFLIYAVILGFAVDRIRQRAPWCELSQTAFPKQFRAEDDGIIDQAIVRTKWQLYSAIRTLALVAGFTYLACVWCFASYLREQLPDWSAHLFQFALVALLVAGVWYLAKDIRAFLRWFRGFSKLRESAPKEGAEDADNMDRWDRITLPLGLARADSRVPPVRLSFAQLRLLTGLAVFVAVAFAVTQAMGLYKGLHVADESEVARTLFIQRTLDLAAGASTAAPTLAFLTIVYTWSVGRMARLALVHGVSRMTPHDRIPDLVSTPIRVILYPFHGHPHQELEASYPSAPSGPSDEAFTRVERQAINTIVRPITGPSYCAALATLLALPVAIFLLSPISSLEHAFDWSLLALHYLCSILIGNTLIQLFQYWRALEQLLKRISEHRLGRSFNRVGAFVRESIHEQVSRRPNDLLRLAACGRQFDDLIRWAKRLGPSIVNPDEKRQFGALLRQLQAERTNAISSGSSRNVEKASAHQAGLGAEVIQAASEVMKLVSTIWSGQRLGRSSLIPPAPAPAPAKQAPASEPPEPDWRFNKDELRWLRDAEAFAATVVAVLINRHVRQLQYFVYTLLISSLVFMLAVLSYPFEPHRLLRTWTWALTLTAVGTGIWAYAELDRNSLLSKIAASSPGKLTFDRGLVFRVLAWGIVPLGAAFATEYPDLFNKISTLFGSMGGN